jgi:hypothetical protein
MLAKYIMQIHIHVFGGPIWLFYEYLKQGGQLVYFGQFLNTEVTLILATFISSNIYVLILTKNGLGYFLGYF